MLRSVTTIIVGAIYCLSLAAQSPISGYRMDVYAGSDIVRDGDVPGNALLTWPNDIAVDSVGNVFIADRDGRLIRRVGIDGTVSTVAGSITGPFATNPATSRFLLPRRVAIGPGDALYISDTQRIYELREDGDLLTVGGAATEARFRSISDIAFAPDGTLYVSDRVANVIRKIGDDGTLQAVAGTGEQGFSGDRGPATAARLNRPSHMDFDSAGNLIFADTGNRRIRRVDTIGMISTVAGNGDALTSGDDGPATEAGISLISAANVAADDSIFIASFVSIRRIDPEGTIRRYGGRFGVDSIGDGGPVIDAIFRSVSAIEDSPAGELYIVDGEFAVVRKVGGDGVINTFIGDNHLAGDGGPATDAKIFLPTGLDLDPRGNLLIADSRNGAVRRVSPSGTIETIAGGNLLASLGDGGPAVDANIFRPSDVAHHPDGSVYVATSLVARVRRIDPDGTIDTVAGTGQFGSSGDGGPATDAMIARPQSIAFDSIGNLFITDNSSAVIRKVDPSGTITTVAGNGTSGFSGDGGPATAAQLNSPLASAWG